MDIDTEQLKRKLTQYLDTITQKKGRNTYICPLCNSGDNGGKNTPAFTVNGDIWHCFACNQGGDLLNLVALKNGLDYKTQFREVAEQASRDLGIYYQSSTNSQKESIFNFDVQAYLKSKGGKMKATDNETEQKQDYSKFLIACKEEVTQTDYYERRGLTQETIEAYNLGFLSQDIIDKYKSTCKLEDYIKSGDYVIPYNHEGTYFIVRHNEQNSKLLNRKTSKPKKDTAGAEPVYNAQVLELATLDNPVYITEGVFDALSIIQSGGNAVALGGTGNSKLIAILDKMLQATDYTPSFIIAMDNDIAGQTNGNSLATELEKRNISYIWLTYPDNIKDPNEWLITSPDELKQAVDNANKQAVIEAHRVEQEALAKYNTNSSSSLLDGIIKGWDNRLYSPIPTGFKTLDKVLDGGLYSGLYAVGALSSLGKTTFILQIADQIAQSGNDVLFFSLEMATDELVGRSLSRLSAIISKEKTGELVKQGKTSNAIRNPDRREQWKGIAETADTIKQAEERYRQYGQNIFIVQGLGDISALDVRQAVNKHIRTRKKTPVVVIDYVQIMDVYNERYTDKQNMDKNIVELKRISRDFKTPVIAISSFNRDSYNSAVTLSAFKESGAIEYTSDVVIALQPQGMLTGSNDKEKKDNIELIGKTKESKVRPLEAVILKNRNGGLGSVDYTYYTLFNLYEEQGHSKDRYNDLMESARQPKENYNPFAK